MCTFRRVSEGIMVFNATFNNVSILSGRSVLLVEETGVPGVHLVMSEIRTHNFSDEMHICIGSKLPYDHDHDGPSVHQCI